MLPVLALIVWIGVYPQPLLRTADASVKQLVMRMAGEDERRAASRDGTTGESSGYLLSRQSSAVSDTP